MSPATDLANGQPAEQGLRCAVPASRLAQRESLAARQHVLRSAPLRYLGCSGFAIEQAGFAAGDGIGLRASFVCTDLGRPSPFVRAVLRDVGRAAPLGARAVGRLLGSPGVPRAHALARCDAGVHCARKSAMAPVVLQARADSDEHFDGRGLPAGKAGDALHLAIRCVGVARVAVVFLGIGGHLDPALLRRFDDEADGPCRDLVDASPSDAYLDAEPGLWLVESQALDSLFDAFAPMAELQSDCFAGRSPGVAAPSKRPGPSAAPSCCTTSGADAARSAPCADGPSGRCRRALLCPQCGHRSTLCSSKP